MTVRFPAPPQHSEKSTDTMEIFGWNDGGLAVYKYTYDSLRTAV